MKLRKELINILKITDWPLVIMSFISILYAAWAFNNNNKIGTLGWVLILALSIFTILLTSLYHRKTLEKGNINNDERRHKLATYATLLIFLVFLACCLFTFAHSLGWKNLSPFELIFPVVTGAVIGFATYFDVRLLYGTALLPNKTQIEFKFWQTILQQIFWFYGFVFIGIILGLDKAGYLMGSGTPTNYFVLGMVLILADFHFLISGRLFTRWVKTMKE